MGIFKGLLRSFAGWANATVDIKRLTVTKDSSGIPVESETTVAAGLKVPFWTDTSNETNQNSKFVDQALGTALIPPTYSVDTTMWLERGGVKHFVVGVDDVAEFGEVLVVRWRRAHG